MSVREQTSKNEASTPTISLVVIELVGGAALARAIAAAATLANRHSVQLLVVCRGEAQLIAENTPDDSVQVIPNGGDTVPQRRMTGLRRADTEIIALVEDSVVLCDAWIEGLLESFENNTSASWGPVVPSSKLISRYRALAVLEYGRYALGAKPQIRKQWLLGEPLTLPGCNMAFRRDELLAVLDESQDCLFEHKVARQYQAENRKINYSPKMKVVYDVIDAYSAKMSTRLQHGRIYGGSEAKRSGSVKRILGAARAILVPIVLTARGIRYSLRLGPGYLSPTQVLWLFLMSAAWGLGEFQGFVFGAGESLKNWR